MTSTTINPIPSAAATFLADLQNFLLEEDADRFKDMFSGFVVSGGTHGTIASLTDTPDSLTAYPGGHFITETGSITYPDDATHIWVICHKDTTTPITNWTRESGTHYLFRNTGSATRPTLPTDSAFLMKVTTASGSVTVVLDNRTLDTTNINRQVIFTTEPESLWSPGDANHFTGDMTRTLGNRVTYRDAALPERLETTTSGNFWIPPELTFEEIVITNGSATLDGSGQTTVVTEGAGYSGISADNVTNITNVSIAASAVITIGTHTHSVDDRVYVIEVVGTAGTVLNYKRLDVTATAATTITVSANTTGLTYTSGGKVHPANQRTAVGGRRYSASNVSDGEVIALSPAVSAWKENTLDSFLLSSAAVILGGTSTGYANGVVCSGASLQVAELNGADINGLGYGIDFTRVTDTSPKIAATNQPNGYGPKDVTWLGFAAKSIGTEFCSAAFTARGKWHIGLDLTPATFADQDVAIALKQDDKIYWNASALVNVNKSNVTLHATTDLEAANRVVTYYNGTVWIVNVKGVNALQVSVTQTTIGGVANTTEHYRVDGTQVIGNQRTGWSATTGVEIRTNFGDASLSDTSQALRALIVDLKAHGAIGA